MFEKCSVRSAEPNARRPHALYVPLDQIVSPLSLLTRHLWAAPLKVLSTGKHWLPGCERLGSSGKWEEGKHESVEKF
jgi:hypothetical protein